MLESLPRTPEPVASPAEPGEKAPRYSHLRDSLFFFRKTINAVLNPQSACSFWKIRYADKANMSSFGTAKFVLWSHARSLLRARLSGNLAANIYHFDLASPGCPTRV